jgi:hypothetical protein
MLDRLYAAVMLRVRLTAARSLIPILERLLAHPSFRYQVVNASYSGIVRGRLDVNRYATQRGRVSVPRSYPVRAPRRLFDTAENRLALACMSAVGDDLELALAVLGLKSRHREHRLALAYLHVIRAGVRTLAAGGTVLPGRSFDSDSLISSTERRIDSGRLGESEPYGALVKWAKDNLYVAAGTHADLLPAEFYDVNFDTTLFEVWLASQLAEAITERLGNSSRGAVFGRSASGLIGRWNSPIGRVLLYFQPSLEKLTAHSPRWSVDRAGIMKPLLGRPDMALVMKPYVGESRVVLIDAKLRQREDKLPIQEAYKMLGYFENSAGLSQKLGAIVYHSPRGHIVEGKEVSAQLVADEGASVVHMLGVDPLDRHGTLKALSAITALVVT